MASGSASSPKVRAYASGECRRTATVCHFKNADFSLDTGAKSCRNLLRRLSPELKNTKDPVGFDERILMSKNAVQYNEDILNAIVEKRWTVAIELLEQDLIEVSHRLKTLIEQYPLVL